MANFEDDFELRFRHPMVHSLSHDGEVAFMASIPHSNHPEQVKDEGSLIVDRTDPTFFRKVFLQLNGKNNFQKTSVSAFLTLNRTTVFNLEGAHLPDDWFLNNRVDAHETNPERIMMVVPAEWLAEAKAITNYKARIERRKLRDAGSPSPKSLQKPKPVRPPSLCTIREMSNGSFSTPIDIFSPLNSRTTVNTEEKFYEVTQNEVTKDFNNPCNQGTLSFSESFEQ